MWPSTHLNLRSEEAFCPESPYDRCSCKSEASWTKQRDPEGRMLAIAFFVLLRCSARVRDRSTRGKLVRSPGPLRHRRRAAAHDACTPYPRQALTQRRARAEVERVSVQAASPLGGFCSDFFTMRGIVWKTRSHSGELDAEATEVVTVVVLHVVLLQELADARRLTEVVHRVVRAVVQRGSRARSR